MRIVDVLWDFARPVTTIARLGAELALSAAILIAAVIAGHELREWREWYPTAYHPWLETPAPVAQEPSSGR